MEGQELYKKVHSEILDYSDGELIGQCAKWGYEVEQKLLENKRYLIQGGAESASSFMYAVVTAVIIGEFAKRVFNDHFSDEAEIDLSVLDMEFEQMRGFLEEDISLDRIRYLEEGHCVGLQDIWGNICEWKSDVYRSLVDIYEQQGILDPNAIILETLAGAFTLDNSMDGDLKNKTNSIAMYEYVNNGFQN
ncbi:MAG: hypothetical protein ACD_81C00058G0002 [uncultured bacterium]|nr:MAG: hypothetical protein ACD_81C00058G0002 [uncultured bacterium]